MRLLLDTHTFLWWLAGDRRLPGAARSAILEVGNEVYVSAASAWEVATKVRLGKLATATWLAHNFIGYVATQGFRELPISTEHAQRSGFLPGPHADPFDRMLVAQAQAENLTLVSNEAIFDTLGVLRIWS
ncbi:MAG TPA: type II toxin-antitoxin system VapC family toxin [Longimicrobiaceae bacterium]|nr:type II toxin-antitoxin system VapC family toxin [Longimicrobiaceae bacterium]